MLHSLMCNIHIFHRCQDNCRRRSLGLECNQHLSSTVKDMTIKSLWYRMFHCKRISGHKLRSLKPRKGRNSQFCLQSFTKFDHQLHQYWLINMSHHKILGLSEFHMQRYNKDIQYYFQSLLFRFKNRLERGYYRNQWYTQHHVFDNSWIDHFR
jgi:hypothetical protein